MVQGRYFPADPHFADRCPIAIGSAFLFMLGIVIHNVYTYVFILFGFIYFPLFFFFLLPRLKVGLS